jgi:hypothetical protein
MIARWDVGLAIDKKVEFLLGLRNTNQPADLLPNLRELVLLRNWIVHGKVYRTELLIERKGEEPNSGTLHLRADGEEWAPKFPRFKFPMPDRLSYPEARGFFLAMCSTIHCLGRSCGFPLVLITDRKPKITIVILGTEQEDPISKLTGIFDR